MSKLVWSSGKLAVAKAYAVHIYTGLGLVVGLLAMVAAAEGRAQDVFIFLALALSIDSTDGALARAWKVTVWTPNFDGRKLDDIIDYLNYTFIPVFFAYQFGLVAGAWTAVLPIVLVSSAYGFCQKAAKTSDGYFTGFPSYWNIVVFYMYVLNGPPAVNSLILLALSVMVFVPIKYIHPSETPVLRKLNIVMSLFWFVTFCIIVATINNPDPRIIYLSLIVPILYMGIPICINLSPRLRSLWNAPRAGGD